MPIPYWVLRGLIAFTGVSMLFVVVSCQLLLPELYYDQEPVPPLSDRLPASAALALTALLMLLPFRLGLRRPFFWIRLAVHVALGIPLALLCLRLTILVAVQREHWTAVILAVVLGALALSLPSTLLWKRYHCEYSSGEGSGNGYGARISGW